MNRHDDSSASGAPLATGSADFSAGTDSPVRIDSSHSRLLADRRRTSAGTIEPTPRCTMSPGTRWVTSTLTDSPSRVVATSWRISECIASAARSARYSLANPRPTDAATITPMMTASIPSPTNAGHGRRGEQEPQQRAVQLTGRAPTTHWHGGSARRSDRRAQTVTQPPSRSAPTAGTPPRRVPGPGRAPRPPRSTVEKQPRAREGQRAHPSMSERVQIRGRGGRESSGRRGKGLEDVGG